MDLDERLAELEGELARLKVELREADEPDGGARSRRDVLKKVGVMAAGAVAGGTALVLADSSAAFATHQPEDLGLGILNSTSGLTQANSTGTGGTAFLFQSGTLFNNTSASYRAALSGWATTPDIPHGIYAYTDQPNGNGSVSIAAGTNGIGALLYGTRAQLWLNPLGAAPSGTHAVGELYQMNNGTLLACVVGGATPQFKTLANATSVGQLTLLSAPNRTYDSRFGGGQLAGNAERVIDLSKVVPSGATAALFNLTATNETASGFLGVFSAAVGSWPGTSNINYTTRTDIANMVVSAVDANRKVKVHCGGSAGVATDFIIDVIGYYS